MKSIKQISSFLVIFVLMSSLLVGLSLPTTEAQTPVLTNLVWIQAGGDVGDEGTPSQMAFYQSMNMTGVIVWAADWGSDNLIHAIASEEDIEASITNAHAIGLKAYLWISGQSNTGYGLPDLSTSGLRSGMVSELVSYATSFSPAPDGVDDDIEEMVLTGWEDLVLYWNSADNALNAEGMEYFVSTFPHWLIPTFGSSFAEGLPAQIDVDSINLMMYGGYPNTEVMYKSFISDVPPLVTSPIHYVMRAEYDLYFPFRDGDGGTFAEVLTWYDEALNGTLPIGFSIFWQVQMDSTQWSAWGAWSTKNNLVTIEPTPTPAPTASPTPSVSPTPAPTTALNYVTSPVSSLFLFAVFNVALMAGAVISFLVFRFLGLAFGIVGVIGCAYFSASGLLIVNQWTDLNTNVTYYDLMPLGWLLMAPIALSIFNIMIPLIKKR